MSPLFCAPRAPGMHSPSIQYAPAADADLAPDAGVSLILVKGAACAA